MAGRKLFINNDGLMQLAANLLSETNAEDRAHNKSYRFQSITECQEYILKQLKVAVKMKKILSISIIKTGTVRIRTADMFISNAETGVLRKWYIGPWRIDVDKYGDIKWRPLKASTLGIRVGCWGGDRTVHPHISGKTYKACLGNAQSPLQIYYHSGEFKAFIIMLIGFLESVNIADTAGRHLLGCREVELDDNDEPIKDEEGNYVYRTDTEVTREYNNEELNNDYGRGNMAVASTVKGMVDTKHKEYLCEGHAFKCQACGGVYNSYYKTTIKDKSYCKDCAKDLKICDICGGMANSNSVVVDGFTICHACNDYICRKCGTCGKPMYPKLTQDTIYIISRLISNGNKKALTKLLKDKVVTSINKNVKEDDVLSKVGACIHKEFICDDCRELAKVNETLKQIKNIELHKIDTEEDLIKTIEGYIPSTVVKCSSCGYTGRARDYVNLISNSEPVCQTCAIERLSYLACCGKKAYEPVFKALLKDYSIIFEKDYKDRIVYSIITELTKETEEEIEKNFIYSDRDLIDSNAVPLGRIKIVAKDAIDMDKFDNNNEYVIERSRING